jgi:hypothetical protein
MCLSVSLASGDAPDHQYGASTSSKLCENAPPCPRREASPVHLPPAEAGISSSARHCSAGSSTFFPSGCARWRLRAADRLRVDAFAGPSDQRAVTECRQRKQCAIAAIMRRLVETTVLPSAPLPTIPRLYRPSEARVPVSISCHRLIFTLTSLAGRTSRRHG